MDLKQVSWDVFGLSLCHWLDCLWEWKPHWALRFSFRRDTKPQLSLKNKKNTWHHQHRHETPRFRSCCTLRSGTRTSLLWRKVQRLSCFGAERKVLPLPNTDSFYPPVCPFPDAHLPSHLSCRKRVVRVLPESSELLHAAPKYATADHLCFSFCISVTTSAAGSSTSEVLLWIAGGSQTHGGRTQQHHCLLKFCAKFKANCSRWSAGAR